MKLSDLVPGGAHTYSRSDDCFPDNAPKYQYAADGCRAFYDGGREFIDWGMGLRAAILGHRYPAVDNAVISAIQEYGITSTRSTMLECELAELMHSIIPCAEMVKFGKNGSDATSAAVKLARAYTGRDIVLIAKENPFISQHNWFIGRTEVNGGILYKEYGATKKYSYNEIPIDFKKWDIHLHDIAAIVLDPSTVDITREKLLYIRNLCDEYGIVMILDEVISGFRYGLGGVQGLLGVTPDLATFGKALGNGYSISALCGKKDIMKLGDRQHGDVFLMSGTYFSETTGYAAALATINELRTWESDSGETAHEYLKLIGDMLINGVNESIRNHALESHVSMSGFSSCPMMHWKAEEALKAKTIFDFEMINKGIICPYWSPSISHKIIDVKNTLAAIDESLDVLKRAIGGGNLDLHIKNCCGNWIEKPVFRKHGG